MKTRIVYAVEARDKKTMEYAPLSYHRTKMEAQRILKRYEEELKLKGVTDLRVSQYKTERI